SSPEYQQHMQQMQMQAQMAPNPAVQVQQLKGQQQMQLQNAKNQGAAITQNAETQRAMATLNKELLSEHADLIAGIQQQCRDHAFQSSQGDMDRNLQVFVAIGKLLTPIIAAQLKGDPSANAGQVLAADERAARAGM